MKNIVFYKPNQKIKLKKETIIFLKKNKKKIYIYKKFELKIVQ
jgi:hypothetical protein